MSNNLANDFSDLYNNQGLQQLTEEVIEREKNDNMSLGDWRALALAVASNYYAAPSHIDKLVETFPKLSAERVAHNLIRLHLRGKRKNIDIATFIIKFQVEPCVLPAAEAIMFGESNDDSNLCVLLRLSEAFPNVLTTAKMNELATGVVL